MSRHVFKFKLSSKDTDSILALINSINREAENKISLDDFARQATITLANQLFKEATEYGKSQSQQQQPTMDTPRSLPDVGMEEVPDNG
jgi:hypothetical protein